MKTVTAYLAIGANIGDSRANMRAAIDLLRGNRDVSVTSVSSLYRSSPVGVIDQPDFLNAAIALQTELSADALLSFCQEVELKMGRKRTIRWGPRVIDLDILLYGDYVINEYSLVIPHPRMLERDFVLIPLAEIASDIRLPGGGSIGQAARALENSDITIVADRSWSD